MKNIIHLNIWKFVDIDRLNAEMDIIFGKENGNLPYDISYKVLGIDKSENCKIRVKYIID